MKPSSSLALHATPKALLGWAAAPCVATALVLAVALSTLVTGCASGPPAPAWQADAKGALDRAAVAWLHGDTPLHDAELARARAAVSATGRAELAARVELFDCALRVASLAFEPCARFDALRGDAATPEHAYADHLAGLAIAREAIALLPPAQQGVATARAGNGATLATVQSIDDPLSRLIATAVLFRSDQASPAMIELAADTASSQGWRRPLLAWLEVQALRAEKAGDAATLAALRRRIALVASGLR